MQVDVDYYADLGLPHMADTGQLKHAHRTLARHYHPDTTSDPNASQKLQSVQEAYAVLADRTQRAKYIKARAMQGLDQQSALNLYPIASHNLLPDVPHEQAYYVLLKVTPDTQLQTIRLPLNICLVLDRSTSMQGARLQHLKQATNQLIDRLHPMDSLSVVVFSDRASVLIPGDHNVDKTKAKSYVSTIQPGGGTEIFHGLSAGLGQLRYQQTKASVNQLILLTDGQTYGDEANCLKQAKWAGANQISLTTLGLGTDWDEDLLNKMAALSGGVPLYIDTPSKIETVFNDIINNLERTIARQLRLGFKLSPYIKLHEAYQITPDIRELAITESTAQLGPLNAQSAKLILLEFRIEDIPLGKQRLMHLKVRGDMPGQTERRTWESVDINIHIDQQALTNKNIPKTITSVLERLSIYKMYQKLTDDLQTNNLEMASRRLSILATRLLNIDEDELAHVALREAHHVAETRQLSAKGHKKLQYGIRRLSLAKRHKISLSHQQDNLQDPMVISRKSPR